MRHDPVIDVRCSGAGLEEAPDAGGSPLAVSSDWGAPSHSGPFRGFGASIVATVDAKLHAGGNGTGYFVGVSPFGYSCGRYEGEGQREEREQG